MSHDSAAAFRTPATPLVADLVALRPHHIRNDPQRPSLSTQRDHFADRFLLGLMRDEFVVVAAPEPEGSLSDLQSPRLISDTPFFVQAHPSAVLRIPDG